MAKPKPLGSPSAGAFAYKRDDPKRVKPSWFELGGYFDRKGKGDRGIRSSSIAQQGSNKGDRESKSRKTNS